MSNNTRKLDMFAGIIRNIPLTEAQLAAERKHFVDFYLKDIGKIEHFTCDDCALRFTCTLVFDAYNTDGDCIAEK